MTRHRNEFGTGVDQPNGVLDLAREAVVLTRRWIGHDLSASLRDAIERAGGDVVQLVVVGQFKRGKTTLINALLGVDLLPRAVTPLTSVITLLRHGPAPRAAVIFHDGRRLEIRLDEVADYVTERGNPRNARGVRIAELEAPADLLADGITLVDTPGTGSIYRHGTEVARGFLPHADAALFVVSADPPLSADERRDLKDVRASIPVVLCVLNKVDQLELADVALVESFTREELAAAGHPEVPVVCTSARLALEARIAGDPSGLVASGLAELEALIRSEVVARRQSISLEGVRRRALAALDAAETGVTLELRGVELGGREARARLGRFQEVAAEIRRAMADDALVARARAERVLRDELPSRLAELVARSAREIDGALTERESLGEADVAAFLGEQVTAAVGVWLTEVRDLLAAGVEPAIEEAAERANALRERAMREAAALFDLAPPPARAAAGEVAPDAGGLLRLDYQATGALELATAAARRLVPGRLGRRAALRAARARGAEMVDRHAGRLRAAAAGAVDDCLRATARTQGRALDETLRLVERAVERAEAGDETAEEAREAWLQHLDHVVADVRALKRGLEPRSVRSGAGRRMRDPVPDAETAAPDG